MVKAEDVLLAVSRRLGLGEADLGIVEPCTRPMLVAGI
jgi:hypothetical protein